ncbi:hypothetical protein LINPERPRIM_LOCUS37376 [Linum perenne]
MSHWGLTIDISCLLCAYSRQVQFLLFGTTLTASSWEHEIKDSARKLAGDTLVITRQRMIWRAGINSVWYERCRRQAGGKA